MNSLEWRDWLEEHRGPLSNDMRCESCKYAMIGMGRLMSTGEEVVLHTCLNEESELCGMCSVTGCTCPNFEPRGRRH